MTSLKDFRTAPDEDILDEMERLLDPDQMPVGSDLSAVSFYQQELLRRRVRDLHESSSRLEKLTIALFVLTVGLLIVAFPPAIEAIENLFR